MNKDELKEIIAYLESNNEVTGTDHPEYDRKVYILLSSLAIDVDYMTNYEEIVDKKIEEFRLEDLSTMYTYLLRGERFCEGLIGEYIVNGTLLELARRHLVLMDK